MSHADIVVRRFQSSDIDNLIVLYQACFAEPPWFESFDPKALTAKFTEAASWPDAVFLVAAQRNEVVGGTIGFDFSRKTDLASLIQTKIKPCFYLSELFVAASMRRQGIADALMRERFIRARGNGYIKAVVRTSINQPIIRSIYERLSFQVVATQEVESIKMVNRAPVMARDQRIILAGNIP
ncbi:MAG TPA: GNAT family N-acetyltransferase [Patescibacteria group bacterium]|nr:GNAT family N-acetyltransferase [Patescibacteria group bacterium]